MIIEPGLPPGRKIRLEGIDTAGWLTRVDQLRLTPTVTEFRTLGEKTCVSCKPNVWGCRLLTWIKFGSGCETSRFPWSLAEVLCGSASLAVDQVLVTVRRGPEGVDERQHADLQIGNRTTTHAGVSSRHQTLASAAIRHNRELAQRQALLKSFVVSKDKQLVLLDRASQRSAKLIPFKRRCARGLIEEVPGIEGAVAQILEAAAVPGVGSR